MRYAYTDARYHFKYFFDSETGAYLRTGVLDGEGRDTGSDPFMASFPHLIDVGIMGHCTHGKSGLCARAGVECYQSGLLKEEAHMSLSDFSALAEACAGRVNQFALGGRGDPDEHPDFAEILAISRAHEIVPNFTTSGYGMTKEKAALCAKYCGAVAVSWYRSDYTLRAVDLLLSAGVPVNLHYVLGQNSIDEAIARLQKGGFPKGICGIVFLLHKPAGQGRHENVLSPQDRRVSAFFAEIDRGGHPYRIGMDSCCVPGLVNFSKGYMPEAVDCCEGGRFSCYVTPDMHLLPCSFDTERRYAVSLRTHSIEEAWYSPQFEDFRSSLRTRCKTCPARQNCMGGCPLMPEVVLCHRPEKDF